MNLIELHILQSFPVTCLNRDDLGAPKTAWFGGCQRARVSSQSWKRAIRLYVKNISPKLFSGKRGHYLSEILSEKLFELKVDEPIETAEKVLGCLANKGKKYKAGEKTDAATFFSSMQITLIAEAIKQKDLKIKMNKKKEVTLSGKKLSNFLNEAMDIADISIFGRMVANDHSLQIEGAGLFSHALSTHAVNNEIDFFSAVDEVKPIDSEGAGHIGTLEYNSACYYRYIGLNMDLLNDADHLAHYNDEEKKEVVTSFIHAALMAVPSGRKNSMFGFNPPAFALGLRRTGQPISLVNAFETPIRSSKGYIQESSKLMMDHWTSLMNTYCLGKNVEVSTSMPENNLEKFIQNLL